MRNLVAALLGSALLTASASSQAEAAPPPPSLEAELMRVEPDALAREALAKGNPDRGAFLFFQPYMACAKCHAPGPGLAKLGPDLSRESRDRTPSQLVEALLDPSKEVKK